ncbi:MAG TPA: GNAT family N-acetyltransferase [Rhizomicrobium sp.]|nr:GNAT family N-acetyltransferase [Rhizomicrobium sp.]
MTIRSGEKADLPACIAILEKTRARYQTYEPQFWKRAHDAAAKSAMFLSYLIAQEGTLFLVAESGGVINGFITAKPQPVPPVFTPGATALIDDFCVGENADWLETGAALLRAARKTLQERGFEQIVVVTAYRDDGKMQMLKQENLSLASAWWVGRP